MIELESIEHRLVWGTEEWLVSAHRADSTPIAGTGKTLRDVRPDFPLLVKRICARDRLSVQVHPNDRTAPLIGGEPKTEMWCVVKAGPLYAGFRPGVTADDVRRAVTDGSFEQLLVRHDAKVGECYFIPGGLVHAIGEGTSVYEVQQSSDTTFRLYDWGRLGADGKPRQLHVQEGLAAMDIALPPPVPTDTVACEYFEFSRIPSGTLSPSASWRILSECASGASRLVPPGESAEVISDSFLTVVKP